MKKAFGLLVLVTVAIVWAGTDAEAQCAMCRAVVENNVTSGRSKAGSGLNTGILYLMIIPYIAFGTLGYLWYKNSKKNENKTKMAGSH
jgi:hypothetical protein